MDSEKWDVRVWTGFVWLRVWANCGLLWTVADCCGLLWTAVDVERIEGLQDMRTSSLDGLLPPSGEEPVLVTYLVG